MGKTIDGLINEENFLEAGAVAFVLHWASEKIKTYREPTRAGTRKGDPIGLSKKKYHAALLMPLYPTLKLKGISDFAHTSDGVLRVWRTDKAYPIVRRDRKSVAQ